MVVVFLLLLYSVPLLKSAPLIFPLGGKDSCWKDSGGGLVCDGILTGIVSFGEECAMRGYPGVYTEVSYYADWVADNGASVDTLVVAFTAASLLLAMFAR